MSAQPEKEKLIPASELGPLLGLKRGTIYAMALDGIIPSVRISNRAVRFRFSDVLSALERKGSSARKRRAHA
jgi:excisionase family DNA binding protein